MYFSSLVIYVLSNCNMVWWRWRIKSISRTSLYLMCFSLFFRIFGINWYVLGIGFIVLLSFITFFRFSLFLLIQYFLFTPIFMISHIAIFFISSTLLSFPFSLKFRPNFTILISQKVSSHVLPSTNSIQYQNSNIHGFSQPIKWSAI